MGFDPRRWDGIRGGSARVTMGADVRWAQDQPWRPGRDRAEEVQREPAPPRSGDRTADGDAPRFRERDIPRSRVTVGAAPGITPDSVRRWGEAMAEHPRWSTLRLEALSSLASRYRARGLDPSLPLEEALERRSPGLGRELRWALGGPRSRVRLAVRAAFALHGPRAADRLDRRPLEVVEELLAACGCGAGSGRSQGGPGTGGGPSGSAGPSAGQSAGRSAGQPRGATPIDPRRREALTLLGLEPDASPAAVKAAHRRLVKRHHPDMGGDVESFRRVDAAYRLLIA
ncbi:MAG: J domain-containing protein [Cyanobacteriota bacterium]|nr:J domain-containing protein [Cyanobacteriota bacterium]